jgi:ribosome-binding ATPase YchF (GTP1/OBG family)
VPQVAVVGYTNVGKSSLVSHLSHTPLECEDKLFVTLDPTARRVRLPTSGEACVLSDTVRAEERKRGNVCIRDRVHVCVCEREIGGEREWERGREGDRGDSPAEVRG